MVLNIPTTYFSLDETHAIDIPTDNFNPIIAKGLSDQRPEILSIFEFLPAFEKNVNELSTAGNMLNLQSPGWRLPRR